MKSLFTLLALLCLTPRLFAQQNSTTAPLEGVAAIVTIRTEGGLQVSETRRVTLAGGVNRVALPGTAGQLRGNSLQTRFIGPGTVEILEQSQRLYSGSPDLRAVLQRYIGKTVTLLRSASEKAIAGTLLQVDGAILLETADGVLVDPTGTYLVPREIGPLASPDEVVLSVQASAGGDYRVESNYLVEGGSWSANYRATHNAAGDRLELHGFAALQLPANLNYAAAQLVLQPQKGDGAVQPLLSRAVDLTRGARQVAFFSGTLAVTQRAVFRASGEFTASSDGAPTLVLRSAAPVGVDLPSGPLTFYRERASGPPEALVLAIAATPASEPLQISLGNLPGISVARRVVRSRQLNPVTMEYTLEITLTNSSKIGQTIEVVEPLPLHSKLTEATPQPVVSTTAQTPKEQAPKEQTLNYTVSVGPKSAQVLRYVVEVKSAE